MTSALKDVAIQEQFLLRQTPQNHLESTVKRKSQCSCVTALDWGLMFLKIASINFRSRDWSLERGVAVVSWEVTDTTFYTAGNNKVWSWIDWKVYCKEVSVSGQNCSEYVNSLLLQFWACALTLFCPPYCRRYFLHHKLLIKAKRSRPKVYNIVAEMAQRHKRLFCSEQRSSRRIIYPQLSIEFRRRS